MILRWIHFFQSPEEGTTLEQKSQCCHLPREPGSCRAAFPHWGFDKEKGTCEEFNYGGCGGNMNRFGSKADCENACVSGKLFADLL